MGIPVKLQVFEGPLDLLLHLIDKNKIDIYDIPIVEITRQYLDYIQKMEKEDLNVMSEFLVMASTLLDIKCRMLLPREVDEEGEELDPRQELVDQLLQYKIFKCMAYELKDRQLEGEHSCYREAALPDAIREYEEPVDMDRLLSNVTLSGLHKVFQEVMKRNANKVDPIRSKFGKIEREEVTLPERLSAVEDFARKHKRFSFYSLFDKVYGKMQIVVTFMAVLELIKTGKLTVEQEHLFGEITILSQMGA